MIEDDRIVLLGLEELLCDASRDTEDENVLLLVGCTIEGVIEDDRIVLLGLVELLCDASRDNEDEKVSLLVGCTIEGVIEDDSNVLLGLVELLCDASRDNEDEKVSLLVGCTIEGVIEDDRIVLLGLVELLCDASRDTEDDKVPLLVGCTIEDAIEYDKNVLVGLVERLPRNFEGCNVTLQVMCSSGHRTEVGRSVLIMLIDISVEGSKFVVEYLPDIEGIDPAYIVELSEYDVELSEFAWLSEVDVAARSTNTCKPSNMKHRRFTVEL